MFVATLFAVFASLFLAFLFSTEGFEQTLKRVKGWFSREDGQSEPASIARLQSRKAEIEKDIEARRAATKFEPNDDSGKKISGSKKLEQVIGNEIEKTPALPPKINRDEQADGESYTSRLLDAKRKLKKKRERNQGD